MRPLVLRVHTTSSACCQLQHFGMALGDLVIVDMATWNVASINGDRRDTRDNWQVTSPLTGAL